MFLWICEICGYGICEYVSVIQFLHETWTRSVFILPDEYWWIGCGGPAPKYVIWFLRGHFGSFGNTLVLSGTIWFLRERSDGGMGWTSTVHRGVWDVFGTRDLHTAHDMLYALWVAQYAIHGLVRQYNIHRDPNHMIICVMCTLHPHTLLTEFYTHKYSYIAEGTDDIWDRGGAPTFWPRLVYMSILTLWFPDKLFLSVYIMYIFLRGPLCEYVYMYTSDYV